MPILFPPRREPRVLAIHRQAKVLLWAVVDPWEIRSSGIETCRVRSVRSLVRRLVRREKPTAVLVLGRLLGVTKRFSKSLRISIHHDSFPRLSEDIAQELFPELARFAPRRSLIHPVIRAISCVLHLQPTPRSYATRHVSLTRRRTARSTRKPRPHRG